MNIRILTRGAAIAALYAALTIAIAPISSGLMQMRVSEALCVLPCFSAAAAPGLFVGCLIANLVTGAPVYDVIFGSLATLAAALLSRFFIKRGFSPWLVPLPAVLVNAVVVGALLTYVYAVGVPWHVAALYVAAGQTLSCYGLGMPLYFSLRRTEAVRGWLGP